MIRLQAFLPPYHGGAGARANRLQLSLQAAVTWTAFATLLATLDADGAGQTNSRLLLLLPYGIAPAAALGFFAQPLAIHLQAYFREKRRRRLETAVRAQLDGASGISIDGHPRAADFDGVYRVESEHKGLPVLYCKEVDSFLYHFEAKDAWRLGGKHRPDEDKCVSHIASPGGKLPIGAQTWFTHSTQATAAPSPEHTEAVFTATLLVRPLRRPSALCLRRACTLFEYSRAVAQARFCGGRGNRWL
eukprot:COSAG04_NODE_2790_length_3569_cov_2.193149_3_plen_246_part_00